MDKPILITCEHCGEPTYLNPGKKEGYCCECGRRVFLPENIDQEQVAEQQAEEEPLVQTAQYDKNDSPNCTPEVEPVQTEITQKSGSSNTLLFVVLGIVLFVIIIALIASSNKNKPNNDSIYDVDSVAVCDTIIEEEVAVEDPVKEKTWNFSEKTDEMTDTKNVWASLTSDDYAYFDFPYDGGSYLKLTVRYMKKYGNDVMIQISRGQFNANEYRGTDYITARFDDGAPKKYYVNEPSDASSDCLFVRNKSEFIKKCKSAKKIVIDVPIYQGGRPTFTFTVDKPLEWTH